MKKYAALLTLVILLAPAVHIKTMDLNLPAIEPLQKAVACTLLAQDYCGALRTSCETLERIRWTYWGYCFWSGGDEYWCEQYDKALNAVGNCWNEYDRQCNYSPGDPEGPVE